MKRIRRGSALLLALLLFLALALPPRLGYAAPAEIYFTAVNEEVLPMTSGTMPFWSDGVLYVSSRVFDGTDLGVNYVRNENTGLAMLYNHRMDLRFDLEEQTVYDRHGESYNGYAVEQGGVVFFPLALVCRCFGLNWSYNETDTVPLIRVTSAGAVRDDASFIAAAAGVMASRYQEYVGSITPPDPPVHASDGRKVYLVLDCAGAGAVRELLDRLGDARATFLLTADQMEDADLLRGLTATGQGIALRCGKGTEEEVRAQIRRARDLLWSASCSWLDLVWYEGEGVGAGALGRLLEETGCVRVTADLDRRAAGLESAAQAGALLRTVGQYQRDLSLCLDGGRRLDGLESLLAGLQESQYRLCAWRLTA